MHGAGAYDDGRGAAIAKFSSKPSRGRFPLKRKVHHMPKCGLITSHPLMGASKRSSGWFPFNGDVHAWQSAVQTRVFRGWSRALYLPSFLELQASCGKRKTKYVINSLMYQI